MCLFADVCLFMESLCVYVLFVCVLCCVLCCLFGVCGVFVFGVCCCCVFGVAARVCVVVCY